MLGVSIKTVRRWADRGMLAHMRTPTGYRVFDPAVVAEMKRRRSPVMETQHVIARLSQVVARLEQEVGLPIYLQAGDDDTLYLTIVTSGTDAEYPASLQRSVDAWWREESGNLPGVIVSIEPQSPYGVFA